MNSMTLNELIARLEEARDQAGGEDAGERIEVLVATQPSYPLTASLDTLTLIENPRAGKSVLWIATGAPSSDIDPYAPRAAWRGDVVVEGEDDED